MLLLAVKWIRQYVWTPAGSTGAEPFGLPYHTLVDNLFIPFHARVFFTIKGICRNRYVKYSGCYRLTASTFLVHLQFKHIAFLVNSFRLFESLTESPALERWEAKGTCIVASRSRHSKRSGDSVGPTSAVNQSAGSTFATSCREQEDSGENRQW